MATSLAVITTRFDHEPELVSLWICMARNTWFRSGASVLGLGCLVFIFGYSESAYLARLLQGAGSSFAFTGAVYLASRGFSSTSLATAIGITQSLGMLEGSSAGEFVVGPLMQRGVNLASDLGVHRNRVPHCRHRVGSDNTETGANACHRPARKLVCSVSDNSSPIRSHISAVLFRGLLFVPTTIGAMTWGVAFFEADRHFTYGAAVLATSFVPLGWAFGCPLMGWAADAIRLRKPVLFAGMALMAVAVVQLSFLPDLLPAAATLFIFGVASGVARIP